MLNVAVPAIRRDLGSSMAGVQWVLSGYTLTLAGFSCCALGTVTLGWAGPRSPYPLALAGLLLTGVASTIAFTALTSLLVSSGPAR